MLPTSMNSAFLSINDVQLKIDSTGKLSLKGRISKQDVYNIEWRFENEVEITIQLGYRELEFLAKSCDDFANRLKG